MPVPAFRNSRSRVRRRRSHHALKPIRVAIDKETGVPVLPHHKAKVKRTEVKAQKQAGKVANKALPKGEKPAKKLGVKADGAKATKVARKAQRESKTK
jgi:ribosomal protein L32